MDNKDLDCYGDDATLGYGAKLGDARASEREESIGLLQPSAHCRAKFERWQADPDGA